MLVCKICYLEMFGKIYIFLLLFTVKSIYMQDSRNDFINLCSRIFGESELWCSNYLTENSADLILMPET